MYVDEVLVQRLHAVVLHHDAARRIQEREVVLVTYVREYSLLPDGLVKTLHFFCPCVFNDIKVTFYLEINKSRYQDVKNRNHI